MSQLKDIQNQVFALNSSSITFELEFNELALKIFKYQYLNNNIYYKFISTLGNQYKNIDCIDHYSKIPFLPIEFFKSQQIITEGLKQGSICFTSSGTTGQITSKHYVNDISIYESSFRLGFEKAYSNPSNYCIIALLPSYLERSGSSLVYMFEHLIKDSKHPLSGFYLNNFSDLIQTIKTLKKSNQKTLLLGVTYALLDLAELNIELNDNFTVMETGGMKGKREELLKMEVHQILKNKFNVKTIHSEYGMTELLSQAYSKREGIFNCPPWMKILIRDINDPFSYVQNNKGGGVNVVDLANINSCSFIETKDLGKLFNESDFEILGRIDNSDLRGCNLMIV